MRSCRPSSGNGPDLENQVWTTAGTKDPSYSFGSLSLVTLCCRVSKPPGAPAGRTEKGREHERAACQSTATSAVSPCCPGLVRRRSGGLGSNAPANPWPSPSEGRKRGSAMGNWVSVSGSRGKTSRHGTGGRRKATHRIPMVPASCCARADRCGGRLSCPSRQHCAREQREPVRVPAPQIPARATEPATNQGPGCHRRSSGTVYFDALFLQQVPQRQLYPMSGRRTAAPAAEEREGAVLPTREMWGVRWSRKYV
jgi:hypothetical protein